MTDRPLFIGIGENSVDADSALYLSDFNFAERRTIVWDPDTLIGELAKITGVTPESSAYYVNAEAAMKLLRTRHEALVKFLTHGGDLVVILRHLPEIHYTNMGLSGSFNLNAFTILNSADPAAISGKLLNIVGPKTTRSCLELINVDLAYTALIESDKIKPLFKVPNSEEVAGGYIYTKWGGCIIFLPPPIEWHDVRGTIARSNFLTQALKLPDLLREAEGTAMNFPSWAIGYRLPVEHEARQRIDGHEKTIAERQAAIETERQSITAIEPRKRLFTGTDTPLEEAVREAFEALGIKARLGPNKHCDVIGLYNGVILAAEVKGLKRGAKPGDPGQCLRWIKDIQAALNQPPGERDEIIQKYADILAALGVLLPQSEDDEPIDMPVKGLVIINAHFDKPLMDRDIPSEPAFNDQVEKIVTREKICAVTGLQLLGMVLAAEADEGKKAPIAQSLIDTVGVHKEFTDWRQFLHLPPPEAGEKA